MQLYNSRLNHETGSSVFYYNNEEFYAWLLEDGSEVQIVANSDKMRGNRLFYE